MLIKLDKCNNKIHIKHNYVWNNLLNSRDWIQVIPLKDFSSLKYLTRWQIADKPCEWYDTKGSELPDVYHD